MIRTRTLHRPGSSLMEVLVAFGILGIAVTSVITLFPFSALTIGQALRDDRTTTCAAIAEGQIRDIHRRYVVEKGDQTTEPYYHFMDNPFYPQIPPQTEPCQPIGRDSTEPSYPVYVDPMGVVAGRGLFVGDSSETRIPRVDLQILRLGGVTHPTMALRYCSLLDSLSFNDDGVVEPAPDMRELRYNWAWMLQRPINRDRHNIRVQVVVYNNRAHLYRPPGSEAVVAADFTPGQTAIVNVPRGADVRKGSWVLDATVVGTESTPNGPAPRLIRNGEFYRVLSVTEVNGTLALEVHKPISRADGGALPYRGTLVTLPGVADVFEIAPLTGRTGP
ncbi:MAG: hypothetical protein RMJ56_13085 [Gemmataceae bacterium]|nr:hypothetical protein [Gemmata sp.]MDW8198530.1 hypothetical protein [Gemmataceae bacterium]